MDELITLSGLLAVIRAYWTFNLVKIERGEEKQSFFNFIQDRNMLAYYLIIRPFHRKKKDEDLRKRVNIMTYLIYVSLSVGIYYATHVD